MATVVLAMIVFRVVKVVRIVMLFVVRQTDVDQDAKVVMIVITIAAVNRNVVRIVTVLHPVKHVAQGSDVVHHVMVVMIVIVHETVSLSIFQDVNFDRRMIVPAVSELDSMEDEEEAGEETLQLNVTFTN